MPLDEHGREPGSPHYGEPAPAHHMFGSHSSTPHQTGEVDEDGNPETPARQAAEKQKQSQRVKVGLALAAIGIVVAVILARRSSANNAGAPTSGQPPVPPSGVGTDLSGGTDLSSLENQLGGLQGQLSSVQTQNQQLLTREQQNANAIASLRNWIAHHQPAQHGGGSTAPEINANNYPKDVAQGKGGMTIVGHIIAGHKYQGKNSTSGAPVYALVQTGYGPVWEQGFNLSQLPVGTPIATQSTLAHYFA